MSKQPNIMKERDIRRKQVLNIGDKVVVRKLCKQMQDKYEGKVGKSMAIDLKQLRIGSHVEMFGKRQKITALYAPQGQIGIDAFKEGVDGTKHPIAYETDTFKPIKVTNKLLEEMGFKPTENCFRPANYILSREIIGFDVLVLYWGDKRESDTEWNVQITNAKDNLVLDADFTYLHELETYVYLTTGEELIKD